MDISAIGPKELRIPLTPIIEVLYLVIWKFEVTQLPTTDGTVLIIACTVEV